MRPGEHKCLRVAIRRTLPIEGTWHHEARAPSLPGDADSMNVRSRGGLERTCVMGARRGWRDVSIDAARRRMFECCVLAHQRRRCVRRRTIRTCFEGVVHVDRERLERLRGRLRSWCGRPTCCTVRQYGSHQDSVRSDILLRASDVTGWNVCLGFCIVAITD